MKKTIATILTILLAASTFTACTQASSTEETSTVKPTETLVSTMDESKKPMQETTVSTETVTAETSPVSDKNEPKLRLCRTKTSHRQLSRTSRKRPPQAKIRAMWGRIPRSSKYNQTACKRAKMRLQNSSRKPTRQQRISQRLRKLRKLLRNPNPRKNRKRLKNQRRQKSL